MKRKPWIILLIVIIVLAALGIGYHSYKLNALKSALRPLASQDEALFKELLDITKALPSITLSELSAITQDNIAARNGIMAKVKAVSPYLYKKQIDLFLKLMEMENEYARSLVSLKRAWLEAGAQPKEEVVTTVEEIKAPKQKTTYRERTFKRTLLKFREVVDKARAASQQHLQLSQKILAFEKNNQRSLSSIIPKRNIIPLLEQLIRELGSKDWGLGI